MKKIYKTLDVLSKIFYILFFVSFFIFAIFLTDIVKFEALFKAKVALISLSVAVGSIILYLFFKSFIDLNSSKDLLWEEVEQIDKERDNLHRKRKRSLKRSYIRKEMRKSRRRKIK